MGKGKGERGMKRIIVMRKMMMTMRKSRNDDGKKGHIKVKGKVFFLSPMNI